MIDLLDFDRAALATWLEQKGQKSFRAKQLMQWIHGRRVIDFTVMTDIANDFRRLLQKEAKVTPPNLLLEQISSDGTVKWLLGMDADNAVECVYIPEEGRNTLCVSSQIGCALNCDFCSTGKQGFNRNLTLAEILGQLWWANCRKGEEQGQVTNVVFMGMGEPLLNLPVLSQALNVMLDDYGYGLSRRRVTVSTSGLIPQMKKLADLAPVSLAVSLHAPNDALRNQLVPINKKYPLKELMRTCHDYLAKAPRNFITFEYVMLSGVNDRIQEAQQLVDLVGDLPCKFNLIPFNSFPGSPYRASDREVVKVFQNFLQEKGFIATIRKTRGDDITAACGQLAGKVKDRTQRSKKWQLYLKGYNG